VKARRSLVMFNPSGINRRGQKTLGKGLVPEQPTRSEGKVALKKKRGTRRWLRKSEKEREIRLLSEMIGRIAGGSGHPKGRDKTETRLGGTNYQRDYSRKHQGKEVFGSMDHGNAAAKLGSFEVGGTWEERKDHGIERNSFRNTPTGASRTFGNRSTGQDRRG